MRPLKTGSWDFLNAGEQVQGGPQKKKARKPRTAEQQAAAFKAENKQPTLETMNVLLWGLAIDIQCIGDGLGARPM